MTWPPQLDKRPFPRCIGFTMFETSKPPQAWAPPMSRCRRVIVPCQQNKTAFEGIGVTCPLEVVPLGVNPEKWPVLDRSDRDGPFTFLMSGGLTRRKNPVGAAKAFCCAFPPVRRDVRLILKTRGAGAAGFWDWMKDLPDDPRIELVREESTPDQMLAWMHQADAFVFPSLGEGFGLPPLEAMATGLPTIVSDNSGMSEYCDPRYNWPVPCREVRVPDGAHGGYPDSWGDCGCWWAPEHDALVEAMRDVERNRVGSSVKAGQGASWVRRQFTVRRTCEGILDVVLRDAGASRETQGSS